MNQCKHISKKINFFFNFFYWCGIDHIHFNVSFPLCQRERERERERERDLNSEDREVTRVAHAFFVRRNDRLNQANHGFPLVPIQGVAYKHKPLSP